MAYFNILEDIVQMVHTQKKSQKHHCFRDPMVIMKNLFCYCLRDC